MADMRLVVTGAAGRMGRMLVKTIAETPGVALVGAIERAGSPAIGEDAGSLAGLGALNVAIPGSRMSSARRAFRTRICDGSRRRRDTRRSCARAT